MPTSEANARLGIHVFGANQGESIVLELPDGRWAVVDCYARSLDDPASNPTYAFLVERRVEQLEFLCLTHPHEDHYRGMSRLLEEFRPRVFCRPAAMNGVRLKWILSLSAKSAHHSGDATAIEEADELERIFQLARDLGRRREQRLTLQFATINTQLYPPPANTSSPVQILAIAPSGGRIELYDDGLRKCFDAEGRMVDELPYAQHNQISIALLVQFGTTRLVLGGDVEQEGWVDAMEQFGTVRLSSAAVKVSHHGSTNGYCEGLWPAFARGEKPIAVLTPYRRHRLPRREALEHISEHSSGVFTSCVPAIHLDELPPLPLSPEAPPRSRQALRDAFRAVSDSAIRPGRCSFVFDDAGNCMHQDCPDPAGQIPT